MLSDPVSFRLDGRARAALDYLERSGLKRSEAVREALVETARRRRDEEMRRAAAEIAADPREQALARAVLAQMEGLADSR